MSGLSEKEERELQAILEKIRQHDDPEISNVQVTDVPPKEDKSETED